MQSRRGSRAGLGAGSGWLVLLLSAAVGGEAQQLNGSWSGSTGQNKDIGFTVQNNRVVSVSFEGSVQGAGCIAEFETTSSGHSVNIAGSSFSLSGGSSAPGGVSFTMSGSFPSSSSASGMLTMTLHSIPGVPSCAGSVNTTWTASKEGGGPGPTVQISVSDLTVDEGDFGLTAAAFEVTLNAPSSQQVSVDYTTTEGSADGGSDFIPTAGTLTFGPGETSRDVVVDIFGDTVDEENENLFLDLSSPSNATLADARGQCSIIDDDGGVTGQSCVSDSRTLCIDDQPGDQRFKVTLHYDSVLGGGISGEASAQPLADVGIPKGGIFSFGDPTNPEVLVKVLNACGLGGRFWVFYAATTTVGFELTVEDTLAGLSKRYTNPDLNPAAPVTDTNAFATCP